MIRVRSHQTNRQCKKLVLMSKESKLLVEILDLEVIQTILIVHQISKATQTTSVLRIICSPSKMMMMKTVREYNLRTSCKKRMLKMKTIPTSCSH